jgi:hypothetical protein
MKHDWDTIQKDPKSALASITKKCPVDEQLIKVAQRYQNQVISGLIQDGWSQFGISLME